MSALKTKKRQAPPVEMPSQLGNAKLRVVPAPASGAQDCGACHMQRSCWMQNIRENHIITNLLVCRIKRNIDLNQSVKLFLTMVRPQLKKLAHVATKGTNIDIDVALADMEAETIEQIQHRFILGEMAYPMYFLFGMPANRMGHYAVNYAKRTKKYEDHIFLASPRRGSDDSAADVAADMVAPSPDEEQEAPDGATDLTRIAREVVDDGVTLTLQEYRVMKFTMTNAGEQKRPSSGAQAHLAQAMNLSKATLTKLMIDAQAKIVAETRTRLKRMS